jgi:hypothetical protein
MNKSWIHPSYTLLLTLPNRQCLLGNLLRYVLKKCILAVDSSQRADSLPPEPGFCRPCQRTSQTTSPERTFS